MRTDQLSPSEKSTLKMRHSPPSIYRSFKTGTSPSGRKAEMVAGMFPGWKVCIGPGNIAEGVIKVEGHHRLGKQYLSSIYVNRNRRDFNNKFFRFMNTHERFIFAIHFCSSCHIIPEA